MIQVPESGVKGMMYSKNFLSTQQKIRALATGIVYGAALP